MALQVAASRMDAAGIPDFRAERVIGFQRSTVRCSGVAVRAVDDATRAALNLQRFQDAVGLASGACIAGSLISLLMALWFLAFGWFGPDKIGVRAPSAAVTACYSWTLFVGTAFGLLRWPQLVRPLAIAYCGGLVNCAVVLMVLLAHRVLKVDLELPNQIVSGVGTLISFFGVIGLAAPYRRCTRAFSNIHCEPDPKRVRFSDFLTMVSWTALLATLVCVGWFLWATFRH